MLPHRGAFVASSSIDRLLEIYQIRAVLEQLVTKLAVPNLREADLKALKALHRQLRQLATGAKIDRWRELNREWHFRLYDSSKSPVMLELIHSLWDRSSLYLQAYPSGHGHRRASVAEHAQILELCERGDALGAAGAVETHVKRACERLTVQLTENKAGQG
jgi:DNA-binding GntR family transcriptional regulator